MDGAVRAMASHEVPVAAWPRVEAPAAAPAPVLFSADRAAGPDRLGRAWEAAFLAELVAHKDVETPFAIGLFGAAGAGKSDLLQRLLATATRLSAAAAGAGAAGRFCPDIVVVRVDAANDTDPDTLLSSAVFDRLADSHPGLAADLSHVGDDPVEAAHRANEALDDVRRRLDTERQALDVLTGREARLAETVLDTPGSLVDSYARSRRSRIERIMRRFGFGAHDPIAIYKDFVREAADESGSLARAGLILRGLTAYQGQMRLIVTAIVLVGLAWGCAALRSGQQSWLDSIRDVGERATPTADWLQGHLSWLGPVQTALLLVAVLLLLLNVIRAARFVLPIARGIDLLHQDLQDRGRDVAGLLAHQTRRVDALAAEAEVAAERAGAAERRIRRMPRIGAAPAVRRQASPRPEAAALFGALAEAMGANSAQDAPRRMLVAIDGLDRRGSEAAARVLSAARRLFGAGIVTIVAAGRSHLLAGFGETDPARASAEFMRCVQLPYRVGAADASDVARRAYAAALIEGAPTTGAEIVPAPDGSRSAFDAPWRTGEEETVAALSPFAGDSPRAIKLFVNLYRVARADPRLQDAPAPVFTALAVALAFDTQGYPTDRAALEEAIRGEGDEEVAMLRRALAVVRETSGHTVEVGHAQRAFDVARSYSSAL